MSKLITPEFIALLRGILFFVQAIVFAHTRLPNLNEGSYLVKGYLFARGVYQPFQPYGFWVNKMYLSFLIWGWVQVLAGLRDVVGIIGSNRAGKRTLLKILNRVTKLTSGRAVINGRIDSLIEVGKGFHSELTDHEIKLISGSIIGISRAEIKRKFDDFLDIPVKRFSTGIEVRSAFSVAIHLDLEFLLFDEVLLVGDASFQQKTCEKINQVSKEGHCAYR